MSKTYRNSSFYSTISILHGKRYVLIQLFSLQNWNFANARKLINSYAYTYRIKIASSLKDVLKKWERTSCNSSVSDLYRLQTPQSSTSSISYTTFMPTKTDLQSTGNHVKKNSLSSFKNSTK